MASQAEVDLIVNATRTLPELERDLDRVITAAQRGMDDIDVAATLDTTVTVNNLIRDLDRVAAAAAAGADDIDLQAVLNQRATLVGLRRDLDAVANAASRGERDEIALQGVLNTRATLTNVRSQLDDVVRRAQRTAPEIDIDVDIDTDRLRRLALSAAGALGTLAAQGAKVGLALGAAAPAAAGLAAAVANIVPAAAVATQGMTAMALVSGTLKLGMLGVEEAVSTAFDPEATPEELADAMSKLAPEARQFVKALAGLKSEFKALQLDVQGRLFDGLGDDITRLSKSVLPDVGSALGRTADSLNNMARGAIDAADKLGQNGTLQTALLGATNGLQNLEKVPGRVVTGFGQLAAASAPAFERLTAAADRASKQIADRLTAAFESGALDTAINDAIDLIKQLGRSAANVLGGLRNIFNGLTQDGRGLFEILENLTQGFQDLTASSEFQTILKELALTADTLVKEVLPLLLEAFKQLAPAIAIIGPPLREFIEEIGPSLEDLIKELGPVLTDLAIIFRDQMPTAIAFAKAAIEDITVILRGLHFVLENFVIPILRGVSDVINSDFVTAISNSSSVLSTQIGNILGSFESFRTGASNTITTVITRFGDLRDSTGRSLATLATNARTSAANFASALIGKAIEAKAGFVRGVASMAADALARVRALPGQIRSALGNLGGLLVAAGRAVISGFIAGIRSQIGALISTFAGITNKIPDWKGPADVDASVLFRSGQLVMEGFEAGITSKLGSLQSLLTGVTASLPGLAVAGVAAPPSNTSLNPTIVVQIGNERLDGFIDTRIDTNNQTRNRVAAQGVRR